ncbi:uncharacterized protein L201_004009 [Kwoniella dendrophila CBS 6074]|uniref:F-box domain-containing protein n=1 Tax=Kwoniella dendrophila CBS 6074 TaxID=1295534 RepID=A0AAX4JV35_9TREE
MNQVATNELLHRSESSELGSLFNDQAYSNILERIFQQVDSKEVARLLRVNKHINHVFNSSSRLQYPYRKQLHSIPDPPSSTECSPLSVLSDNKDNSAEKSVSEKLENLLEKEERLDKLHPRVMKCIHIPNSKIEDLKDGYILMSESTYKFPIAPGYPDQGYRNDSWSIWKITDNTKDDVENLISRGASKSQGYYKWKFDPGYHSKPDYMNYYDNITMCLEDNVIATSVKHLLIPPHLVTEQTTESSLLRIHFKQLIPLKGTAAPPKGVFKHAARHPEAAFDFIEVRVPAKYICSYTSIHLAPGGKVGVLIKSERPGEFSFLGFWNWKTGVSLGRITPTPHMEIAEDFQFFGNFVIASSFRNEWTELDMPKTVIGKNAIPGSDKQPIEIKDGILYHDQKRLDMFTYLETFELMAAEDGKQATLFPHEAYPEQHSNNIERCSWDYQDTHICIPITSHRTPAFNRPVIYTKGRFHGLPPKPGNVIPQFCSIADVNIDNALLKGERNGVLTFTISVDTVGEDGYPYSTNCHGTIDLQEMIKEMTIVLTKRIKSLHRDRRNGHTIQTKLHNMWSDDPSIYQFMGERSKSDDITHLDTFMNYQDGAKRTNYEEGWEKYGSLRFSTYAQEFSTFGTRSFTTEPDHQGLRGLSAFTGSSKFLPYRMIMRDFNSNLVNQRPNSSILMDGNTSSSSSSNEKSQTTVNRSFDLFNSPKRFKDTIVEKCKLPKPIALPKFHESVKRINSDDEDIHSGLQNIFMRRNVVSALPFRESSIKFLWDTKRDLHRPLFDGDLVVLRMQNGAIIMTFD